MSPFFCNPSSIVSFSLVGEPPAKPDNRLQEENDELRRRLAECTVREELARKRALDSEREINELNERHEQKLFTLRLDYETKSEQLNNQLTDQQLEMLTLRQKCEMLVDEKCLLDERINDIRSNEQQLKVKLDGLQMENEQLIKKIRSKPLTIIATTQTVNRVNRRRFSLHSTISSLGHRQQTRAENRRIDTCHRTDGNASKSMRTKTLDREELLRSTDQRSLQTPTDGWCETSNGNLWRFTLHASRSSLSLRIRSRKKRRRK